MRKYNGFSLRELFVVVVVVSILAVIAVPAYIQAQVRAKIVTVRQDNQALHNALLMYAADHSTYPVGTYEAPQTATPGSRSRTAVALAAYSSQYPDLLVAEQRNTGYRLMVLTTPHPYLNQLPNDPFQIDLPTYERKYMYYRPKLLRHGWMAAENNDRIWPTRFETVGSGPDRVLDSNVDGPDYDPTNGVFSAGDMHFYGPGFMELNPKKKPQSDTSDTP